MVTVRFALYISIPTLFSAMENGFKLQASVFRLQDFRLQDSRLQASGFQAS